MQKNHSVAFGLIPASIDRISNISPENCLDIGFVGDVYARDDFLTEMGYGRLSDLRDAIWRPLSNTPLIVANLEAPITDKELAIEKKPYLHKTSTATLALFDERFVLSLANNHIMDYGASGLNDTIDALNKAGIQYAGAGQNLDQAKTPCLLTVEGIRIAVICAADPRFYPATETSPGTCPAHQSLLVESIQSIKNQVDFVIVSVHMGLEYVSVPSFNQMNLTQACFDAGTNVVHFHHAHCLSGAATNGKDMVFFGTGNYVFTKKPKVKIPVSRRTAAWCARIDKQSRQIVALTVEPLQLNEAGLPITVEENISVREIKRLRTCRRRMLGRTQRQWQLITDLFKPYFLRINAYNYGFLLRKRGLGYVIKAIKSGLKSQLSKRS